MSIAADRCEDSSKQLCGMKRTNRCANLHCFAAHLHNVVRELLLQQSLDCNIGVAPTAAVHLTEATHTDARPEQQLFWCDLPLVFGFFLQEAGTKGVFGLIAFAMAMVVLSIGIFGPRTNDLELEQISH